ncbi:MAG: hypothetical protein ABT05_01280 [Lautropia sp. SCN 66-9]|nr:MAG: hypothetical protein ABT05_01280 [Lautropia sp. SCN 66-9]
MTGQRLDVPDIDNGRYVDAISGEDYLVRVQALRERRWRVNDNLPGSAAYCPLIRRTARVQERLRFDPAAALAELGRTFGASRNASCRPFSQPSRIAMPRPLYADAAAQAALFSHSPSV